MKFISFFHPRRIMISSNRFVMQAGLFRWNFRGLPKVLVPEKHVLSTNGVHRFVHLCTFMRTSSVKNVVGHRKRKFCSQIAESSEVTLEDIQQDSSKEKPNTAKIFEEIAAGDPQCLKRLKILEFEVAVLREEEHRVPDNISKKQWLELLEMNSVSQRRKHLAFLRLNELKKLCVVQKSAVQRESYEERKREMGFHYYGLSGHSMFMRIYERAISKLLYQRLLNAKLEIVMDCSYQSYMSNINLRLCAKQIAFCLNQVKTHKCPSSFRLCNLHEDSALGKLIPLYSQSFYKNPFFQIHSESYLDLFPKERLLYLSPHTKTELKYFDPNDVFIIGAYVDKGTSLKVSLAKAKEHRLRIARLPIDEYLLWKKGTKSLALSTVLNIILDMAFYNDWRVALKNIPKRCLTD